MAILYMSGRSNLAIESVDFRNDAILSVNKCCVLFLIKVRGGDFAEIVDHFQKQNIIIKSTTIYGYMEYSTDTSPKQVKWIPFNVNTLEPALFYSH